MKTLKNIILESIHKGSMQIDEIIRVLHREYNLTWFNAKEYPEVGKFLPYSKIDDLDDVEIFSDYGDGFYWMGKGSETLCCIVNGINFYNVYEWQDGEPNWVQKFWSER